MEYGIRFAHHPLSELFNKKMYAYLNELHTIQIIYRKDAYKSYEVVERRNVGKITPEHQKNNNLEVM